MTEILSNGRRAAIYLIPFCNTVRVIYVSMRKGKFIHEFLCVRRLPACLNVDKSTGLKLSIKKANTQARRIKGRGGLGSL